MAFPAFALDVEQITKVISCSNLLTFSFVTACGVALRFRERETQTTVRASSEKYIWAYLLFSFLTAFCLMNKANLYATLTFAAVMLIILIRLCFAE